MYVCCGYLMLSVSYILKVCSRNSIFIQESSVRTHILHIKEKKIQIWWKMHDIKNMTLQKRKQVTSLSPIPPSNKEYIYHLAGIVVQHSWNGLLLFWRLTDFQSRQTTLSFLSDHKAGRRGQKFSFKGC